MSVDSTTAKQLDIFLTVCDEHGQLTKALADVGLVHGKYRDMPYSVDWFQSVTLGIGTDWDFGGFIIIDKREFGQIALKYDGSCEVHINIAEWLNPDPNKIGRVKIPMFPIGGAKVKYSDICTRRYSAFDRARERASIAAALDEDKQVYGTSPYKLVAVETHGVDSRTMYVLLEDRALGTISVTKRGTFMIDLDFSRWLRGTLPDFVLGMDIAAKADRMVAFTYAKEDAEVTITLLKNRWGNL